MFKKNTISRCCLAAELATNLAIIVNKNPQLRNPYAEDFIFQECGKAALKVPSKLLKFKNSQARIEWAWEWSRAYIQRNMDFFRIDKAC